MSDAEQSKEENKASKTDVSAHVQTVSLDRISKSSGSQGITINFYTSSYAPRSDKPIQTEPSRTELVPELSKSSNSKNKKLSNLASESREIRSFEYAPSSHKKSATFHETKQNKLMNSRKFSEGKSSGRMTTDLERKKLEAELKATEEIAKIQQTVIEKRLALELASLQDGNEYHQKSVSPQHSTPHDDLGAIEEVGRKQNKTEHNQTHDLDSTDPQARVQPPRPPPPTRVPASDGGKISNLKADTSFLAQTSSDLNPLRQLIEKKLNLDMRSSRTSDLKHSPPPSNSNSQDRRYPASPSSRFAEEGTQNPVYPTQDQPGCSPHAMRHFRTRSLWKSAVMKIKKRLRPPPKPPQSWE